MQGYCQTYAHFKGKKSFMHSLFLAEAAPIPYWTGPNGYRSWNYKRMWKQMGMETLLLSYNHSSFEQ